MVPFCGNLTIFTQTAIWYSNPTSKNLPYRYSCICANWQAFSQISDSERSKGEWFYLPLGVFVKDGRHFWLSQMGERALLVSSRWRPGILVNIVQHTNTVPQTKNYLSRMSVAPKLRNPDMINPFTINYATFYDSHLPVCSQILSTSFVVLVSIYGLGLFCFDSYMITMNLD